MRTIAQTILTIGCQVALALTASQKCLGQWPEFRGPQGSGIATIDAFPIQWNESHITWKTAIPGRGWSSPVVADNEIWLTTALGENSGGSVQLQAICIDRQTGQLVYQIDLFEVADPPAVHTLNSFASPTGAIDADAAYFSFGTMGTCAVARSTGAVLWRNTELKIEHETGPGSSLALCDDRLIVHCDGTDQQFIAALSKTDGRLLWKTPRSGTMHPEGMMQKAFSTPTLTSIGDRTVVLSAAANWLYCYDVADGRELWKYSYGRLGFSNVPHPLVDGTTIFVTTGFSETALMALEFDRTEANAPESAKWTFERQVPTMPSPLLFDGLIFMVNDKGIATCVDAATGEMQWQKRLRGEFSSSPILVDGKLFVGNRHGEVFVIAPSRTFELLTTNELDAAIMGTPAADDESVYWRTAQSLYRISASSK